MGLFEKRETDYFHNIHDPHGYNPTGPVINTVVTTNADSRRPCWVNGKRAFFHCWANTARPAMPRGVDLDENPEYFQLAHLHAVVEFEDGHVERVWPQDVKFADGGRFEDFAWTPQEEDDAETARENEGTV